MVSSQQRFFDGLSGEGVRNDITFLDPALPVEGYIELDLPAEQVWHVFTDVRRWPRWNPSFWWARVSGNELRTGALLYWCFNPIRPWYPYKMPAVARIIEYEPYRKVTWEVTHLPGFRAKHSYSLEALGSDRCRFGSWEVAEGPLYRALRRFWMAHFCFVCQASLSGAKTLERRR